MSLLKKALPEQYFSRLPSEFKKYSEGHVEQTGDITIDGLQKHIKCDQPIYSANMISFLPLTTSLPTIAALERSAGCELWPWAETYILKDAVDSTYLKRRPEHDAPNILAVNPTQPLIKIQTINNEWIRAAILDVKNGGPMRKTEGFIKLDALQSVN